MDNIATLLTVLQYGDSFFPSGVVSFSGGLETLYHDGQVTGPRDVERFIEGQLRYRWASVDRPALIAAHTNAFDLDKVVEIDGIIETIALASEMRYGSRRTGRTLLNLHLKLQTKGAGTYRDMVREGRAFGHAPVVQGMLLAQVGLDDESSAALVAHGIVTTFLGASLRMGILGHVDSQNILTRQRETIQAIHRELAPSVSEIKSYVPAAEIAMMRHETSEARLFAS